MKKILLAFLSLSLIQLNAQDTATFENFLMAKDSFLNGKTTAPMPRLFKDLSHGVEFSSTYDTSYGGYWKSGFAVSSMTDTTNGSFNNLYSSANGSGVDNSMTYLVGQQNAQVSTLPTLGNSGRILSLMINNTTYVYKTMLTGNQFSRKFTAQNKDSFVLWIYLENTSNDSIRVDLANFRNSDTTKNFILDSWITVDIPMPTSRLRFKLVSSDNGQFGMNTPSFFAIDNVVVDFPDNIKSTTSQNMIIYPNPSQGVIYIKYDKPIEHIYVKDLTGKLVIHQGSDSQNQINITSLKEGTYIIEIYAVDGTHLIKRIVKCE